MWNRNRPNSGEQRFCTLALVARANYTASGKQSAPQNQTAQFRIIEGDVEMKAILTGACVTMMAMNTAAAASAADIKMAKDDESGFVVYTAKQGDTTIRMVPEAGANVFSIKYKDRELLRTPKSLKDLPGFMYGNPVLYPTPNRVRDGVMTFGGKQYKFPQNNGTNFLHGLVHSVPWKVVQAKTSNEQATIVTRLEFEPGTEFYKLFPHKHAIELSVTLTGDAVRFAYTVDNTKGDGPVPFGWAYHPWFLYQGERKQTYLTIPATHLMESEDLLPTGKLLDLKGTKFDGREPITLEGFVIDDVYYGMQPSKPAVIDFRDKKLKITLSASEDFKHLVVYTPAGEPWFCVENQTCSTDAHNMHTQGKKDIANLIVVEPGKKAEGYAEFKMSTY